ncbi:MAG: WG repeat-containing protein [Sulfurovaceae bacterium]
MKRVLLLAVVVFAFMFIGCSDDGAKEKNDDTSFASIYDYITPFHDGYAAARLDDKWGIIDKSGKKVTAFTYEYAHSFFEGLASIKRDGKYGYIDFLLKGVLRKLR